MSTLHQLCYNIIHGLPILARTFIDIIILLAKTEIQPCKRAKLILFSLSKLRPLGTHPQGYLFLVNLEIFHRLGEKQN